jgi:O-antigen ligase
MIVFFYFFIWPLVADVDFEFITRIAFSLEGGIEGEDRDLSIVAAWQDFLRNPIIGSSFVGTLDGYYPHNIVVEALMATGIVGGVWFVAYLLIVLFKCFGLLYKKISFPFAIIMLVMVASSLLSGALFMGVDIWPWSVFIVSLYSKNLEVS